jgi:hypothetical protein
MVNNAGSNLRLLDFGGDVFERERERTCGRLDVSELDGHVVGISSWNEKVA